MRFLDCLVFLQLVSEYWSQCSFYEVSIQKYIYIKKDIGCQKWFGVSLGLRMNDAKPHSQAPNLHSGSLSDSKSPCYAESAGPPSFPTFCHL